MRDQVHIERLRVETIIGPDAWHQLNAQQCYVTLDMGTDFSKAAAGDDLKYTLNYAVISREVTKFIKSNTNWGSLGNLSRSISQFVLSKYLSVDSLRLELQTQTAHIRSNDISCVVYKDRVPADKIGYDLLHISNLKLLTLIGVFAFERLQKQFVTIELKLPWPKEEATHASYQSIIDSCVQYVENSKFLTVEALVESVAKVVARDTFFMKRRDLPIEVKVVKLNAITSTSGVGVSYVRTGTELDLLGPIEALPEDSSSSVGTLNLPFQIDGKEEDADAWYTAYLAFGSNVGDKVENIRLAIDLLSKSPEIKVKQTSSLFESKPMYFKDQDSFMNGCIEVKTTYSPQKLLSFCKEIEYEELKRVKKFDNGPRIIDLDIIMFLNSKGKHILVDDQNLTIPHARMLERSFVLEPLCEIVPPDFAHPLTTEPLVDHLDQIYSRGDEEDNLCNLLPITSGQCPPAFLEFKNVTKVNSLKNVSQRVSERPTLLMAILNTTPDSFSDGGLHYMDTEEQLLHVKRICSDAFKLQEKVIIDVGGCSTRPNSIQASETEELKRVIPIIKMIRGSTDLPQERIIISIDTYRSVVAQEAINAGANIVNDISGGSFDPKMYSVIAANPGVSYVLSHTRGDITNMITQTKYEEHQNNTATEYLYNKICHTQETTLIRTICKELSERYIKAIENGVARWQIILDPGIGFAKNGTQNFQIIKQLQHLKNFSCVLENGKFVNLRNLPVLVGPSRKNFIGKVTNDKEPSERDFGTGAILSSCVGFGADLVRVHNVKDCSKAIKLADALYKDLQ